MFARTRAHARGMNEVEAKQWPQKCHGEVRLKTTPWKKKQSSVHFSHGCKVCSLREELPNGKFENRRTIRHVKSNINCQFTLLLCQFVIIYGYKQLRRGHYQRRRDYRTELPSRF